MLKEKILRKETFLLYIVSFLAVGYVPFLFSNGPKALFFSAIFLIAYIITVEVLFRIFYSIKLKRPYRFIPKIPFKRIYVEPHPYLSYVYKKNFICQRAMPANYPLHKDKGYIFDELRTNNLRLVNGPKGDRDIEIPKPKDLIRVNCLGDSTTINYISYNNQNYSYPMELEKILKRAFPDKNIEVNNFGQGAYSSAEILIKFLLDTIDTEPDIIVLYSGYNDLFPSLTGGFQSDYSHARRNLGESYHLYKLVSMVPGIPLASWNFMVNNCLFSQNVRFSLWNVISKEIPNIENDFIGLNTYLRNIEHIINICKANSIKIVLSTYCHYLHDKIKVKKLNLKFREGLRLENEILRKLASKHNIPLVESDLLIPQEDEYFVDSIHFTPEGMQLLAENISLPVINHIKNLPIVTQGPG